MNQYQIVLLILMLGLINMVYGICKNCKESKQIYSGGYCRSCYKYNLKLCVDTKLYDKRKSFRPSIIHVYIHSKLKDNCDLNSNKLSRELVKILFLRSHIPNLCHNDFLCEMEELGMIKLKDKQNIEIIL